MNNTKLLKEFNNLYPNGSIVTTRIMTEETRIETFKATIIPDCSKPERYFTAYWEDIDWDLELAENLAIKRVLKLVLTK